MSHHYQVMRMTHKLAEKIFADSIRKAGAPGGVEQTFFALKDQTPFKTYRTALPDGTKIAVRFNMVDGSVFFGMDDEID